MITDLYDLTLAELMEMLEARKEGHAYHLWKQAGLMGMAFGGKYPETPKRASPELFPAPKRYKMPDFLKKHIKKKGG